MTATFAPTDEPLALAEITVPEVSPEATLAEKWAAFHSENPHVYAALVRRLEADLADGFSYVSLKFHVEALRRQGVRTTGRPYAINNSHTAFYAHKVAAERPELAALLRLKGQADPSP